MSLRMPSKLWTVFYAPSFSRQRKRRRIWHSSSNACIFGVRAEWLLRMIWPPKTWFPFLSEWSQWSSVWPGFCQPVEFWSNGTFCLWSQTPSESVCPVLFQRNSAPKSFHNCWRTVIWCSLAVIGEMIFCWVRRWTVSSRTLCFALCWMEINSSINKSTAAEWTHLISRPLRN